MQRFLSKINRGLILFSLLFIGLSFYLITLEVSRYAEKDEIISACQIYIEENKDWVILPEEHRFPGAGTGPSAYLSSIRNDVSSYLLDDDNTLSYELDRLMMWYDIQRSRGMFIESVTKVVEGSPMISYNEDIAYVKLSVLTTITYDSASTPSADSTAYSIEEQIALKKQDGKWKIYYSQLEYPMW